jgi:16S rRNA (adenine1518-N6/adenine1519-N6)-dimethyltransferase
MQKLGQHFLKNKSALQAIAESLEMAVGDLVIEIGPGHGELTHALRTANATATIVAIEKDHALADKLKKDFEGDRSIEIMDGDALLLLPTLILQPEFADRNYKIVGNIPYYITGHLFRTIGELGHKPTRCVFTTQKEVAVRACAVPPHMNRLAASIQFWASAKIIKMLDRSDFSPPPKVSSAIMLLIAESTAAMSPSYDSAIHALFAQPRKTIMNNLAASTGKERSVLARQLSILGIAENDRPQNLSISNITALAKEFFLSSPEH